MTVPSRYSGISTLNHWITALLITAMLVLGFLAAGAPNDDVEGYVMSVHVSLGFFAFLFVIWRAAYRLYQGFPDNLQGSPLERQAAYYMHRVLLALIVLQVFTGPLYLFTEGEGVNVFGWFTVSIPLESLAVIHEAMEWLHVITGLYVLPILLVLHILGAARHYLARHRDAPADMD